MDLSCYPDNPYILLTPGPLSTSKSVKAAMLRDWCTWDADYNSIVTDLRERLAKMASDTPDYTATLMQGSGTFCVESCIGTLIPEGGALLVPANGAYGARIAKIGRMLRIPVIEEDFGETSPVDPSRVAELLGAHPEVTHVAVVHCETTTGMLNPVAEIGAVAKAAGKIYIVDAMSSFGGIPMDMAAIGADALISSANKCIQGVPGFGFVLARRAVMEACAGQARSLSLDLYDQWQAMERGGGKWRFTSPTHVVRAFAQAMDELAAEGGVAARFARYRANQAALADGMAALGFSTLLPRSLQSPIITSFLNPAHPDYAFKPFYERLKAKGFVIYPGKVTSADTFRIGNIGEVYPADIERLLAAVRQSMYWSA
ncbi:2-aminoethylphosphonate--pyruvate transaminase [Desulfovibrio sulfodismutans]|uniref:2-aminoethylphosphonate--pyruvate transaminase n=1 Tax=Desulfolutivibrio sulfodismutans TaxID=63561 RepID=A0A7K3NJ43_9BACT|nr:2-aminoethylphosphonate--pyruvate transaminase [Desulfolutivibrio sulfodismutans]NDY56218.1 2-aminoethylphosphonate--pyruvate transaminase [Desulfolutivibrio sulfodismutans]QLA12351.1 2-aminoethylphosphonate--pyruvate transaminase [Desulfolutivibrio sulfodismutans DSM 3696]